MLAEKRVTSRLLAATQHTLFFRAVAIFNTLNMSSTPATKEDIQELLAQFSSSQAKILEDKIAEASANFDTKLKSATSVKLTWKREGHKRQYNFNQSVLDHVVEAERKNQSTEVQQELTSIKALLEHRQKLIRLADTSPSGWATVEEYENNELANDSGDDKKITRAEDRAARKLKAASSKKSAGAKRFKTGDYHYQTPAPATTSVAPASQFQFFRGQRFPTSKDICYACGSQGHWRKACPNISRRQDKSNTPSFST
ncbi:uncharacterized protein LOC119738351 isoform X2 [Patiria miniata]|uniref:CCHC-type domain-containing protein n=1 Tax=Patiria miniata TaxID=46514 RepID=A0A914AZL6_PATMI|nr:uncharacterized protein LOC119738351 isoform X2 [Patiria miniata]